jgi:hypothetical protein
MLLHYTSFNQYNKEMKMKKQKTLAGLAVLALALGINGCGEVGGDVTLSGKAIDPYITGATVYLDVNGNYQYDNGEPTTTTDENGSYTLTITHSNYAAHYALVVEGGYENGVAFHGVLTTVPDANMTDEANQTHITPFTSLVEARYHAETNVTEPHPKLVEIRKNVADYLGLDAHERVLEDFVHSHAEDAAALAHELVARAIGYDANKTHQLYCDLAKKKFDEHRSWHAEVDHNSSDGSVHVHLPF